MKLKHHFPDISGTQLLSYILFILSGCILTITLLMTMNITVLKDFKIVVPKRDIHAGDTVTLATEYTKTREVSGRSSRYIECYNRDHLRIRYLLNEAVANRGKGTGGTGLVVTIPTTIPDLPKQCWFTIAIQYDVYPWRKVNQSASSASFTLLPASGTQPTTE